jgi:hypothetical protein
MGVCAWNHFPSRIGRRRPHLDSFHCTRLLDRRGTPQDKGSTRAGLPFQHGCCARQSSRSLVETPGARLLGPRPSRVGRSPDPAPPRPYSRCGSPGNWCEVILRAQPFPVCQPSGSWAVWSTQERIPLLDPHTTISVLIKRRPALSSAPLALRVQP